jgi:preprotein translocase subunit SecA
VDVKSENKTLATITFQNYFRLYDKLSGMTGTALTEETEFRAIYNLDIVEIPTNRPLIRMDHPDSVYKSSEGKYRAIIEQIAACHEKGRRSWWGPCPREERVFVRRCSASGGSITAS